MKRIRYNRGSEEIRAIWDRDAAQGKPAQKHLNGPKNA